MKDYCVLVPCYNEEKSIGKVIDKLNKTKYPYLIINDGSTDKTYDITMKKAKWILNYPNNRGKGFAIKIGAEEIIHKGYDWIVIMDGDGQSNIKDINKLLKLRKIHPNASIIIGNRLNNPLNMPTIRLLANKVMSWVISLLSGQKVPDTQCWLKIIHKDVFNLDLRCDRFDFESELLVKAGRKGYQIVSGNIDCIYPKNIKSHQNYLKDWWRFIKLIIKLMGHI